MARFLRTFTAILPVAAALTVPASASALALEQVGNFDRPTYVTSDPHDPDRLFVVEQPGRIQLIEGANTTKFLDITSIVLNSAGTGLYSMAFSPDYATNHLFYVAYTGGVDDPATEGEDESDDWHIDEFSADGDTADPDSRREVLTIEFSPAQQIHYGGQLQFGPDGYLYASTGDGGPHNGDPDGNAQNLDGLLGKILRIDPQGSVPGEHSVPADNPFVGPTPGEDEIWSYGLRNPWRFSFDRLTGDLVIGDVGWGSWEEVDYQPGPEAGKGDNFGWNCREAAHPGPGETSPVCADRAGTFTEPVFEYPHALDVKGYCSNLAAPAIVGSITGGYVVRDRAINDLYGRYLYSDYCTGELRSLDLGLPSGSPDRAEGLSVPSVTTFGEDADCRIYVASGSGPVYRLTEPAGGVAVGCPPPETEPVGGPTSHDGPPNTTITKHPKDKTKKKTATFEFSGTDARAVASFQCSLDGGAFATCASPHTVKVKKGNHTFEVRAIDEAGNIGAAAADDWKVKKKRKK